MCEGRWKKFQVWIDGFGTFDLASVAFGNAWNGPSLRVEQSDDHRAKESRTKSAQKDPVDVNLES
jgi:hypothetical protein